MAAPGTAKHQFQNTGSPVGSLLGDRPKKAQDQPTVLECPQSCTDRTEPMHGYKTATAKPSGAHEAAGLSDAASNAQLQAPQDLQPYRPHCARLRATV